MTNMLFIQSVIQVTVARPCQMIGEFRMCFEISFFVRHYRFYPVFAGVLRTECVLLLAGLPVSPPSPKLASEGLQCLLASLVLGCSVQFDTI